MLKSQEVINFQSHEDSKLDFTSGINAIIGRSNKGKTALLRSFLLLITNRPLGFRYHSHFATSSLTRIASVFSDVAVTLSKTLKGKTGNVIKGEYLLGKEPFEGFGDKQPPEILRALNFSEVNIQKQLDEPFLITSTPGEVARVINRVTKLEKVDGWVSKITKWINTENAEIGVLKRKLTELEAELKTYENLDEAEKDIIEFEEIEEELNQTEDDIKQISYKLEDIANFDGLIVSIEKWLQIEAALDEAESFIEELKDINDAIEQINRLLTLTETIKQREQVELLEKTIEEYDGIVVEERRVAGELRTIEDLHDDIMSLNEDVKEGKEVVKEAENDLKRILRKLRSCPTCFTPLTDDKIKRIME